MTKHKVEVILPEGLVLGDLVTYYLDGNRSGYLESATATTAKIIPVAAYKAGKPHVIKVPLDDVRAMEK